MAIRPAPRRRGLCLAPATRPTEGARGSLPLFDAADVLALQRDAGNQATTDLIRQRPNLPVQRLFDVKATDSKAHLRHEGAWKNRFGPRSVQKCAPPADPSKPKLQGKVEWAPAVNVVPGTPATAAVAADRVGYVRKSSVVAAGDRTSKSSWKARVDGDSAHRW